MIEVTNKTQLIENGETALDRKARELALNSLEAAVNAVDPKRLIETKLQMRNSTLQVDQHSFDLSKFEHVYVLGGGKASAAMAQGLEHVLGKRITRGLVNVPHGTELETSKILLHGANHPVPDEAGVEGTRRMVEIAEQAEKDDLIVCLISGGGSSLMPLPRDEISIADKRALTDALLKSGATINEINTVRKHASDFKGGWLAKKAYPATIVNLILSDVVGDPLDFIASGPTVPDSTTFSDAVNILKKYKLWTGAPSTIKKVLANGEKGLILETPKAGDEAFKRVFNVVIGNNRSASLAASEYLRQAGLRTILLTATLEGEARQVGLMLASIAREVGASGNPASKPMALIAGGETTVVVKGKGLGGRNQEIPLAAATKLHGQDGVVVASLSTDGVDGPTDAAGAVADGKTLTRAKRLGLFPDGSLAENDSYHFFSPLKDLVFTGPTGTNVNDVSVVIVL